MICTCVYRFRTIEFCDETAHKSEVCILNLFPKNKNTRNAHELTYPAIRCQGNLCKLSNTFIIFIREILPFCNVTEITFCERKAVTKKWPNYAISMQIYSLLFGELLWLYSSFLTLHPCIIPYEKTHTHLLIALCGCPCFI